MKKLKHAIIYMCVAATVAAGALFPSLAAHVQDSSVIGSIGSSPIRKVSLSINQLHPLEKLSLLVTSTGSSLSISADRASLSEDEVAEIVYKVIQQYSDIGLIPYIEQSQCTVQQLPFLRYGINTTTQSEQSNIFWQTSTRIDFDSGTASLYLIIDDETGSVFSISYSSPVPLYSESSWTDLINIFSDTFISGAGLSEGTEEISSEFSGNSILARYSWYDITSGEIRLEFLLSEYGIYADAYMFSEGDYESIY